MKINFSINWDVKTKQTEEKAKQVLFDCMIKMQELAIINCPVDTGRLRNSIKIYPTTFGHSNYILFTIVEYAEANEFGTIKMSAHPYFRPALIQVKNIWVNKFWKKNLSV